MRPLQYSASTAGVSEWPSRGTIATIGATHHTIAGMEPQIAPRLDSLVRHAEIARGEGEGLVSAQHELAWDAVGQRSVRVIDHPRLEPVDNWAHRSPTLARQRAAQYEIRLS
jgi:hypothetical protein